MKKAIFCSALALAPLFLIGCVATTPPVVVTPAQQPTTVVTPSGAVTAPPGSVVTVPSQQ